MKHFDCETYRPHDPGIKWQLRSKAGNHDVDIFISTKKKKKRKEKKNQGSEKCKKVVMTTTNNGNNNNNNKQQRPLEPPSQRPAAQQRHILTLSLITEQKSAGKFGISPEE